MRIALQKRSPEHYKFARDGSSFAFEHVISARTESGDKPRDVRFVQYAYTYSAVERQSKTTRSLGTRLGESFVYSERFEIIIVPEDYRP